MELYQGINSFNPDSSKSTAVKSTSGITPVPVTESKLKAYVCTSIEELQTSMEIDASVKVAYSVYSVDAKAKYLHSLNLTTNSVTVLIYGYHKMTTESSEAVISDDALSVIKSALGVDNFVKKYGDSWVSKISKGGEFLATFTFYSQTKEEKEAIEVALDAKGSIGGVSVDASLSTKISNALKTSKVSYGIDSTIIGYSSAQPPSFSGDTDAYTKALIDFANSLASKKPDNPETISYILNPYESLLEDGIDFSTVTQNRNNFLGNPGQQGWGSMYAQLLSILNACNEYKEFYHFYGDYIDSNLNDKFKQIQNDVSYLFNYIDTLSLNSNKITTFTTPVSLDYGIPHLNYSVLVPVDQKFLYGGGGSPFDDISTLGNVSEFIKLTSVQYAKGDVVDWFQAKYSKRSLNKASDTLIEITETHGNGGGTKYNEWVLGEDEFITSLHGYMGTWIGHSTVGDLIFKSNKGILYGTAAEEKVPAEGKWDVKPGDILIGFAGWVGDNIDCLQPKVLRLSPAKWE